jgi:hypothetical protein
MFESEIATAERSGCANVGEDNRPCLVEEGTDSGQEKVLPFSVFCSIFSTAGDELESKVHSLAVDDNVSVKPTS